MPDAPDRILRFRLPTGSYPNDLVEFRQIQAVLGPDIRKNGAGVDIGFDGHDFVCLAHGPQPVVLVDTGPSPTRQSIKYVCPEESRPGRPCSTIVYYNPIPIAK